MDSEMKMEMSNIHISEYLVEDILSRLPVKSLKRFMCVQVEAVRMHLIQSLVRSHPKLYFRFSSPPSFTSKRYECMSPRQAPAGPNHQKNVVLSLIPDHSHDHEVLDLPLNLGYLLFSKHGNLKNLYILGACINGRVCLYDDRFDGNIIFWNLAMREFKVLPARPISCPPEADYDVECLGFGYDPKVDDYKLVRTVYIWEVNGPLYPLLIEVYSLRTNSLIKIDSVLEASPSLWGQAWQLLFRAVPARSLSLAVNCTCKEQSFSCKLKYALASHMKCF